MHVHTYVTKFAIFRIRTMRVRRISFTTLSTLASPPEYDFSEPDMHACRKSQRGYVAVRMIALKFFFHSSWQSICISVEGAQVLNQLTFLFNFRLSIMLFSYGLTSIHTWLIAWNSRSKEAFSQAVMKQIKDCILCNTFDRLHIVQCKQGSMCKALCEVQIVTSLEHHRHIVSQQAQIF